MMRITLDSDGKTARRTGSPLSRHIGVQLNKLRQGLQVSMQEVAEGAGLSRAFICDIENGHSSPSATTLWKLAKFFEVPIDRFFRGFEDDPPT